MLLAVLAAALTALFLAAPPVQTLVVITPSWKATSARVWLVEDGKVALGPIAAHVGHGGLGWGLGIQPRKRLRGPKKREGDGRSPAGVFRLGALWRGDKAAQTYCVDDPKSSRYAEIVTLKPKHKATWKSAEEMSAYRVALVIEHNPKRRKRAGSCIFLHDGQAPTVGCTALAQAEVDRLVKRLKKGARVIQLTEKWYRRRARRWKLPKASVLGL